MKRIKENLRPLLLLIFMPAISYIYTIMNHHVNNAHDMTIKLDTYIPFVKIFVLPYMFWHVFIPLTFIILCFMDRKTYFKTMLIYVVGCLIANMIFAIYQTTLPRAILVSNDTLTHFIKIIYSNDNPVNCFPSIHVFTSYLMIRAVSQSKFSNIKSNLLTSTIGVLIIASTLLVKQHTVLDVISGILLGEFLIQTVNHHEKSLIGLYNKKLIFNHSLRDIFEGEDEIDDDTDEYKISI